MRSQTGLDLRRDRDKLVRKEPVSELTVRWKVEEFRIALQNRCSALTEEAHICSREVSDNLTPIITECAIEVGSKIARQITSKLSEETKDLIRKRQGMTVSIVTNRIELAELLKLISVRQPTNGGIVWRGLSML